MLQPVNNWQQGWKWVSTYAFLIITFLTVTPIPPELMEMLPTLLQDKLVPIVAFVGLLFRFIDQSSLTIKK